MLEISAKKNKLINLALLITLFLLSFGYFTYGYQYFDLRSYHVDEATSIYGAVTILDGGMVYRDFWAFHTPGRYYVLAAVFKIFGTSLKTANLFAIFILTLTVFGTYLFLSKLYSRSLGILALILSAASLKLLMMYNRPVQYAILFYVLTFFPLREYIFTGRRKWLIIAGALSGAMGLFRLDFQIYSLISILIVIIAKVSRNMHERGLKAKAKSALNDFFCLFVGAFLITAPNLLYFINSGGYRELHDYILSGIWDKNNYVPIPEFALNNLLCYFPLLIGLLAALKLLFFDLKDRRKDEVNYLKIFFLFSTILFYIYTLKRADNFHFYPARVPGIILLVMIYADFMVKPARWKYPVLFTGFAAGIWFLFFSVRPYFIEMDRISKDKDRYKIDIPRAQGFYDTSEYARSVVAAVKYIQNNTEKGAKIYVGNLRHDRIVNNDMLFYFLAERFSGTKYCHFEPGFTTTRKIQKEIIQDLIKNDVRYIVLWAASEHVSEPNQSTVSSGIKDLDNFILEHYKVEEFFGKYIILKRKSG